MTTTATARAGRTEPTQHHTRSRKRVAVLSWIAEHAVLIALALIFLLPIAFVLLNSFMGPKQTLTGDLWPRPWDLDNYRKAFNSAPLARWFANSFLYAGLSTVLMLISSVPMAYVLAKIRIRFSSLIFFAIIVWMLLPKQVTQVPIYVMWAKLGLTGTLWPLILPHLFGDAFSVFLLRQFFLTIPNDYLDAARIDGNGEWGSLLRVMVPMGKPGIAATSIFLFFYCWNDYYGPLLYASEFKQNWPVSFGLASFHGSYSTDWGIIMAVTILAALPVTILFYFAQKIFVQGITLTGVKG